MKTKTENIAAACQQCDAGSVDSVGTVQRSIIGSGQRRIFDTGNSEGVVFTGGFSCENNRPQSPFAPHYSGNFDWFLPFGSRSIAAVGNEKPTGRPGYNRCFGRCRNSSYHHTPDFSTIECFGSTVCLWRSGFGVRPDLYDGMEGRRGPDADYSVRCCDQLGFGSV